MLWTILSLFSFFSDKFSYVLLMQTTHWNSSQKNLLLRFSCLYIYKIQNRTCRDIVLLIPDFQWPNISWKRCSLWQVPHLWPLILMICRISQLFPSFLYKMFFSLTNRWWNVLYRVSIPGCKINAHLDIRIDTTGQKEGRPALRPRIHVQNQGKPFLWKALARSNYWNIKSLSRAIHTWKNKI